MIKLVFELIYSNTLFKKVIVFLRFLHQPNKLHSHENEHTCRFGFNLRMKKIQFFFTNAKLNPSFRFHTHSRMLISVI